MEQSFLFTVFWKDEMYIGDISEMMDNLGCITDGNNIVPITAAWDMLCKTITAQRILMR